MSTWVLLRGLAREARHWGEFAVPLQRRTAASTVVALDLPGNGFRRDEASPLTVAAMVDVYRAALRQRLLSPPYTLFALSLGGMVATAWASSHPEEVRAAALVNASMRGFGRWHQRLRPRNYLRLLALLVSADADAYERGVMRMTARHPHAAAAELLSQWSTWRRSHPVSARNALRQLGAAAAFRAPDAAPPMPLLVLASARDDLVDPDCSVRMAHAWGAGLAMHPTAGHDLPLDDQDWVLREVAFWMERAGLAEPAQGDSADADG